MLLLTDVGKGRVVRRLGGIDDFTFHPPPRCRRLSGSGEGQSQRREQQHGGPCGVTAKDRQENGETHELDR